MANAKSALVSVVRCERIGCTFFTRELNAREVSLGAAQQAGGFLQVIGQRVIEDRSMVLIELLGKGENKARMDRRVEKRHEIAQGVVTQSRLHGGKALGHELSIERAEAWELLKCLIVM